MPKYRINYDDLSELDDSDDSQAEYERNRRQKALRNEGLESFGKGGNKDRSKRNKKETHRVEVEDDAKNKESNIKKKR